MAENKKQNQEEEIMNETQISFKNEDGTEELCQILFTYSDEVQKKNYMFFYPVGAVEEAEEDEELEVYCATYEIDEKGEICNIKEVDSENEEENKMIEEVFNQYLEDCECDCGCDCEDEECECHDELCSCHHHEDK